MKILSKQIGSIRRSGFLDLLDVLVDDVMHFAVRVTNEGDDASQEQERLFIKVPYSFPVVVQMRILADVGSKAVK